MATGYNTSSFYPDEEHLFGGLTSQQRADVLLAHHQRNREYLARLREEYLQLLRQVADAERKRS